MTPDERALLIAVARLLLAALPQDPDPIPELKDVVIDCIANLEYDADDQQEQFEEPSE